MSAGLSVRALQPVVSGLEALGYDPAKLLAQVGVDRATLASPNATVPHAKAMGLWQRAVEQRGDTAIGLHVAQAAAVESFDVHAYAVFASSTLRAGLWRACRYQRLVHEATELRLEDRDGETWLRHRLPGGLAVPRPSAEFLLTAYVRLGRIAAGRQWSPRQVRFAHARPSEVEEHERWFGAPLEFSGGENAVSIADEILDAACPSANPGLAAVLDRYAGDLLERLPRGSSASARVRAYLGQALSAGPVNVEQVAAHFKMSSRTLRRALRAEGTCYKELLDQLRRERALALLGEGRASIAEVSFLLGFADISAFYRAFRRWTGKTPRELLRPGR